MTAEELHSHFNRVYGMEYQWPKTYEVDAVTYGNCCQYIFNWANEHNFIDSIGPDYKRLNIAMGKVANGLMFKNVELILKS